MRTLSVILFYTALLAIILYGFEAINGSYGHIVNTLVAVVFLLVAWAIMPRNALTKHYILRLYNENTKSILR